MRTHTALGSKDTEAGVEQSTHASQSTSEESKLRRMHWKTYGTNMNRLKWWRKHAPGLWVGTNGNRRFAAWYAFMIWATRNDPRAALVSLDVAIQSSTVGPPQQHLHDCLAALAKHFLTDLEPPQVQDVEAMHKLASDYVEKASRFRTPYYLQQNVIFLIIDRCSIEQTRSLFRTLLTHNVPLSSHTLLHFADRFLEAGEGTISSEILRSAANLGADLSSDAFQSVCVKLLRTRPGGPDWINVQSAFLSQILEIGVKPRVILWNCIILNTVEAGDSHEAWRWYEAGIKDGLQPDRATFSVLLKTTKHDYSGDSINRIIGEATREGVLPNDFDLICESLHGVYLSERSRATESVDQTYESMLEFYSRYFDLKPLEDLGLRLSPQAVQVESDQAVHLPPSRAVGLVLLGFLGQHPPLTILLSLYLQFHDLVISEHPIIAPLAMTDHVSNAFIKAFGSSSEGLGQCTMVVKNMLKTSYTASSNIKAFGSTTPDQTGKPTAQTWNILLNSYMKHGQTEAAEKIMLMMRARGIEPNSVTWNHLIAGYVGKQDVENVIHASRRMVDAGIEYDDFTIQALRRLTDKTRYLRAMERDPSAGSESRLRSQLYPTRIGEPRPADVTHDERKQLGLSTNEDDQESSPKASDTVSGTGSKGDTNWLDQAMALYGDKTKRTQPP